MRARRKHDRRPHRGTVQDWRNGSRSTMVSLRSGPVETMSMPTPTNSAMRSM